MDYYFHLLESIRHQHFHNLLLHSLNHMYYSKMLCIFSQPLLVYETQSPLADGVLDMVAMNWEIPPAPVKVCVFVEGYDVVWPFSGRPQGPRVADGHFRPRSGPTGYNAT